jgi:sensor domain CHASE-containing protein
MDGVTGIITAASAFVLAVTGLLGTLKGLLPLVRESRKQTKAIGEVHALVNNQLDAQLTRNEQLTRALTAGGVDVPERPAGGDVPGTGD